MRRNIFSLKVMIRLLFFIAASQSFLSCITPPGKLTPKLMSAEEMEVVSKVSRGRDYALSGRELLAEREFREGLRISPKSSLLYSNLAQVLQSQDRIEESIRMSERALSLMPKNYFAREGFAYALYKKGALEEAAEEFAKVMDGFFLAHVRNQDEESWSTKQLSVVDVAQASRNIAIINYVLGRYDDAVCYSRQAVEMGGDPVPHIRLLFSLDKTGEALQLIKQILPAIALNDRPDVLLDYSIAVFSTDRSSGGAVLTKEATDRVITSLRSSEAERKLARVIKMELALRANQPSEVDMIYQTMLEEDPRLCGEDRFEITQNYLPSSVIEDHSRVKQLISEKCNSI